MPSTAMSVNVAVLSFSFFLASAAALFTSLAAFLAASFLAPSSSFPAAPSAAFLAAS
ncbi:hypothetical protein QP776_05965 [Gardnerella vaginalis]|nr:hypothetical protein [Gardnerella vaginalis]